jgi:ArsR family transcriptional regulator, arsenate/arsenite/antimonite-responsive transcriptional repressor
MVVNIERGEYVENEHLSTAIDTIVCDMKQDLPLVECCTPLAISTLSTTEAAELEKLFKALADRNRLRILNVLLQAEGEAVCVCEFQPTLGISQPTVSHHLKQLVEAGLLEREKRGTFAFYRLKPGVLDRIGALIAEPRELAAA